MTPTQAHLLDIIERVVKTFTEGFLVTWAVSNYAMTKVALIAAGMAGLSAVWNITGKANLITVAPPTVVPPSVMSGVQETIAETTKQ